MLVLLLALLMEYPGFCGSNYQTQSVTADQERTVNWYFERMESPGATSKSALYPTPGVEKIAQSAYGPGRAHFFQNGREFAVLGPKFHEINLYGAFTERGTVAIDGNPATISSNGDGGGELFITSGGNGYIFDLGTSVFTQITALNGLATMGDFMDGYFLALNSATSTWYISNLLDGLTWQTGSKFAQRLTGSDPWVSLKVNGRYIWLLGTETSEVWYNNGNANFTFAPHPSGFIPYGIAAPFSVAVQNGNITWLGADKTGDAYVLRASGFTPEVVSDYPLQYAFNQYGTIEDATADVFNYLGHAFYRLTFKHEDVTWTWDSLQGRWFEWMTWISEENKYVAGRAQWHAMAFGEHRMLDSQDGSVYRMASHLFRDADDRPIRRLRRAPCLFAENEPVFFSSFELDLEPGLGLNLEPGGGIVIETGVNDAIDIGLFGAPPIFLETVYIPPGTYLRVEALCIAVQEALDALMDSATCGYKVSTGRIFLEVTAGFLPSVMFGTGPSLARSIGPTLGFLALDFTQSKTAEGPPIISSLSSEDPQVMLRFSNDGGKTWSVEEMRGSGKSGEYMTRVRWNRLGRARRRVFEITTSDAVPYRISNAYIKLGQPVEGVAKQGAR